MQIGIHFVRCINDVSPMWDCCTKWFGIQIYAINGETMNIQDMYSADATLSCVGFCSAEQLKIY